MFMYVDWLKDLGLNFPARLVEQQDGTGPQVQNTLIFLDCHCLKGEWTMFLYERRPEVIHQSKLFLMLSTSLRNKEVADLSRRMLLQTGTRLAWGRKLLLEDSEAN